MRILRGSMFVLMVLFLAGAGNLQAVAPPQPWICPFSETECDSIPWCWYCKQNDCTLVSGSGDGRSDCKTIYWQATAVACDPSGSFCSQIIVTP